MSHILFRPIRRLHHCFLRRSRILHHCLTRHLIRHRIHCLYIRHRNHRMRLILCRPICHICHFFLRMSRVLRHRRCPMREVRV
jgi:hypothetical protein